MANITKTKEKRWIVIYSDMEIGLCWKSKSNAKRSCEWDSALAEINFTGCRNCPFNSACGLNVKEIEGE